MAWEGAAVFGGMAFLVIGRLVRDCAAATGVVLSAIEEQTAETGDVITERVSRRGLRRRSARADAAAGHAAAASTNGDRPHGAEGDLEDDLYASLTDHTAAQSDTETPDAA
jgi:hypothetical protein